jgi:hypothetical protein
MSNPSDLLGKLYDLPHQASSLWEQTLADIALRALRDGGVDAVRYIEAIIEGKASGKLDPAKIRELVGAKLSLRDASDFLAVLERGEADRLDRSRELLQKVVAVATTVAEDLLKIALGGRV